MITGPLRSRIDKLWEEFWTGGITNPLTVIEQISFLMFARLLDLGESTAEKRWNRTQKGKPFPGASFAPTPAGQQIRWSNFRHLGGEAMLPLVRDQVFPHFRTLGTRGTPDDRSSRNTFGEYMKDAQLMIQKPSLLVSAVQMIDELPLGQGDTKGDLYEYLLGKLTTAGINGQFRTPRHIINLMVDLLEPEPTWVIGDPACGTGGFLVSVMEHLRKKYTSPEGRIVETENGVEHVTYTGDLLEPYRKHIQAGMFHGFDFDVTMLRIAAMNLMLHGVDTPDIHYQDTLSNAFPDKFPKYAANCFDLILANPPFKGSLDEQDVHPTLTGQVKTRKTELLFLVLILRMLKLGGRCAVIVPDGVLFGSSNAHVAARKLLVEENQLDAVVKLPAGVFKPYAGVSTAIVFFTKGGQTTDVWFYDVQADGFSLDDKRDPVEANDLPDVRARWAKRNPKKQTDRTDRAFFVPKAEIAANKYDLSLNRYKEIVHEEVQYEPPKKILARLKKLEAEIARDLEELEGMLG
ncbi:MAG TPA: N-6 DNA methylase [Planctomycetaceae bacterium]|nr:N-6 DNA methylase [Planctomycetaceae bacterium]